MRALWGSLLMLAAISSAAAEQLYDHKLEQATIDIVARRIGELRGGLAAVAPPAAVAPAPRPAAMPVPRPSAAPRQSWRVATGTASMKATVSGSIETFSDGTELTPQERRALQRQRPAHVLKF